MPRTMRAAVAVLVSAAAAHASAAEPVAKKGKAPKWKSSEVVTSSTACGGEDGCGARVQSRWSAATKVPLGASSPDFEPSAVLTVAFGEQVWAAPLSADPAYAQGARRATFELQKVTTTGAGTVTARLRWNERRMSVRVSGATAVTLVDFVDDPSPLQVAVRVPLRGCVELVGVRADYGIVVAGRRDGRRVGGGDDDEGYVLPSASLKGVGLADERKAPPQIVSDATVDGESVSTTTNPFVDLAGVVATGGSIARLSVQVDGGVETDVPLGSSYEFPCGGMSAEFAATAQMQGEGPHTVTLRATDDAGRIGTATHEFRLVVPDLGPRVARLVPLGLRVPGAFNDAAGLGLVDETGRLWFQDAKIVLEEGEREARPLASARPTSLTDVVDVRDLEFPDEKSQASRNRWFALHGDGTVSIGGEKVPGLPEIAEIATIEGFDCCNVAFARGADGTVWARGTNRDGQLGDGSGPAFREAFAQVPGIAGAVRLETRADTCFALTGEGELFAWGPSADRLRGDEALDHRVAGLVPTDSPIVDFAATGYFSRSAQDLFTVHADGTVRVRGDGNSMRYPGNGTVSSPGNGTLFPETKVASLSGMVRVEREQGVNGGAHAFAVRGADGALFGWGINSGGEVGDGTRNGVVTPLLLDFGGARVREVQCRLTVAAAVTDDGRVFGWGGNTTSAVSKKPTRVEGVLDVVQFHLTWFHGFALTSGGTAYMWETFDDAYHPRAIVLKD